MRRRPGVMLLACLLALLASGCGGFRRLAPRRRYAFRVPADGTLIFTIRPRAGLLVRLGVDQGDVDGVLSLPGLEFDGFDWGREEAIFAARASGGPDVPVTFRAPGAAGRTVFVDWIESVPDNAGMLRMRAVEASTNLKRLTKVRRTNSAEVLAACRQAVDLWSQAGDLFGMAASHLRVGEWLYGQDMTSSSAVHFVEALRLARMFNDPRTLAEALTDSGELARVQANSDLAYANLDEALALWLRIGLGAGEASARNGLALLDWQGGNWQKAASSFARALELVHGRDDQNEAVVLTNLGLIEVSLGSFDDAADYFSQAAAKFRALDQPAALARVLTYLGRSQMLANDLPRARSAFDRARVALGDAGNATALADLLNNLGQLELAEGKPEMALGDLKKARNMYDDNRNARAGASARHHLGLAMRDLGKQKESISYLREALRVRLKLGLSDEAAETMYALAIVARDAHHLKESRKWIESAVSTAERLRTLAFGDYFRASYFSTKQKFFDEYVSLLMELHKREPDAGWDARAFEAAARARARALLESLLEVRGQIRVGMASDLLTREEKARRHLNFLAERQALLSREPSGAAEGSWRAEIAAAEREYHEIEAEIRQKSPRYAALIAPSPLSFKETQELLDPDVVLLQFFLGEKQSFLWLITATTLTSYVLPARADLEAESRALVDLAVRYRERLRDPALEAGFQRARLSLGRRLLGKLATNLRGQRLIIAADGILQYVPFAALAPGVAAEPLGVTHEIVQIPSASTLAALRARELSQVGPGVHVTVFADPISPDLPRLAFSVREAQAIRAMLPPARLTWQVGTDATKANYLKAAAFEEGILHLATHGKVNDRFPETSWLAFSGAKGQERTLFVSEIYNLKLRAALITLSGCETGIGKDVRGEGLMGFSRALFYAGAARLLVSLWPVEDAATAAFAGHFYSALLRDGKRPPAALQFARREMAKQDRWRDPYLWAGFVLMGDFR